MVKTIYDGKVNSPETTLLTAISAYDVSMNVADSTLLPAAPNVCTIGTGEDCETVHYTSISGTAVSGLTRAYDNDGVYGLAKNWGAGETVARRMCKYDFDAMEENIGAAGIGGTVGTTDNGVPRADGIGGSTVQASLVTIDDTGNINIPTSAKYKINSVNLAYTDVTNAVGGTVGTTDEAIPRANGTGGFAVQGSLASIDDTGNLNIPTGAKFQINGTALAYTDVTSAVGGSVGATDNILVRTNGTGGAAVQSSGLTCDDSANVSGFKSIDLTKAVADDHSWSGVTATMTAKTTYTIFQIGYIDSSGQIALSDADASATMPVRAMATAAITGEATGSFLLKGFVRDDTWNWTVGGAIYASGTLGGMTQTAPTASGAVVQIVGYAVTADIMYFSPDLTFIQLA